jgi:hypothetical protein
MTRSLYTGVSTNGGTVTVYWAGTSTKPTIYVGLTGAAKSNPITAEVDGSYSFYIDDGHYKITNGTPTGDLTDVRISYTPEAAPSAKGISVLPFLGNTATTQEAFNEAVVAGSLSQSAGTFTGAITDTQNGIGVTSTDGLVLTNNTAAANAAQQWSPRLRFRGYGWETSGTDTSLSVDWIIENQTVQSTLTEPGSLLAFSYASNSGAYTKYFALDKENGVHFYQPSIYDAATDLAFDTTTGSKLGTATTQKIGFWGSTAVVQPAAQADASGGATVDAEARTAINGLLAKLRTIGIIAT